ncbi:MAG TPA: MFS transporter [Paracoccaceae bacterium]|nr:MFS transporter [Paracoccaceae bacterium]
MTSPLTFLFRNRDFGLYFGAMFLVNIAVQIQAVTIGWQIYDLARETRSIKESAFLVGMVGLVQFLPLFALTLFAGSLADRISRRAIVLASLVVETACAAALVFVSLEEVPQFTHIFAIAALFGAARAFLSPASTALVPMLVPRRDMPQAISLKSLSWQGAVIIGPWIGGMLCALSTALSYGVTTALYGLGIAIALMMRANTTPERQPGSALAQIRDGLVYVWNNKIIFGAMSLDLFAVLLGGVTALLPAFAADVLQVGPSGFGLLRSGPALGAASMAIALTLWPMKRRAGARMFWAVAAFGLATLVFAVSRNMVLSIAALAALGAADMISVYVRQTLVQIVTPDHMRGRVSSVSGLFISGSNELGEFESGVAARLLGPVGAAIFGGIGTIIVTGLWAKWFPDLRRADRLDMAPPEMEVVRPHSVTAPAS